MSNAPDLALRSANLSDAPRLTRLARESKARWNYPAEWLAAWRDDLTITPDYVTLHRVFVAESLEDANVIGVCALEDHGDHWELGHLWIAPESQRRGVGRALVAQALATARAEHPERAVRVTADPNAVGFYERLGAHRIGSVAAPMPGARDRDLPVLEFGGA